MVSRHTATEDPQQPELATYSPAGRELLRAVRDLIRADRTMRRDLGARMEMNSNELLAIRQVLEVDRQGENPTPRRLATFLGISTAATTTLIDGLVSSGHLLRMPHPSDGRSKVLVATAAARQRVHAELGGMHQQMCEVADAVPPEARPAVISFLHELTSLMESADATSLTPRAGDTDHGAPED
jgi:DNA-binding MarR family transcriptional regulator